MSQTSRQELPGWGQGLRAVLLPAVVACWFFVALAILCALVRSAHPLFKAWTPAAIQAAWMAGGLGLGMMGVLLALDAARTPVNPLKGYSYTFRFVLYLLAVAVVAAHFVAAYHLTTTVWFTDRWSNTP